jgi:hypothetical protein
VLTVAVTYPGSTHPVERSAVNPRDSEAIMVVYFIGNYLRERRARVFLSSGLK